MNTPILLLIFNRAKETKIVFDKIRAQKPSKLYIASDGPRNDKEREAVMGLRNDLLAAVDWDCEVNTLFRDQNLGCGTAPYEGISWFFEHEEMGIILEDDCLPNDYFFSFCGEVLEKYKDAENVFHVCGNNFNTPSLSSPYSYHFGYFAQVWGWASWRRAWKHFRFRPEITSEIAQKEFLSQLGFNDEQFRALKNKWAKVGDGRTDIWDIQWHHAIFIHHGLVIVPRQNLISNIGFGDDATHTKNRASAINRAFKFQVANPEPKQKEVVHPPFILVDPLMNEWFRSLMYKPNRKVQLAAWKKLYLGRG